MKYKVGDKVKIRKDLNTDIKCWSRVMPEMLQYAGRNAVIDDVTVTGICTSYRLDIDSKRWKWNDEMLETVSESPRIAPKINSMPELKHMINFASGRAEITIPIPSYSFVDRVLRSTSYQELMWLFLNTKSPSKEISESYAALHWCKKFCKVSDYYCYHIGDGAWARTAAIFAFFTKSINESIDPALNFEKLREWRSKHKVERIDFIARKIEEAPMPTLAGDRPILITCVHAHVDLEVVDKKIPNWRFLYTNPCCYTKQQVFSEEYMREHNIEKLVDTEDFRILSDKRNVVVYRKNRN